MLMISQWLSQQGTQRMSKQALTNYAKDQELKAAKITKQLSRLWQPWEDHHSSKRKLFMEACNGILLYSSEVWAETLKTKYRAHQHYGSHQHTAWYSQPQFTL
ncbi:hypothetical protein EVAR_70721_1 [Eumeta japonica]|uniref:Uncharacterized protein n=1 Tax=Eumeta variegata TaxID=151549 RepID=A0A4C1SRN2_EUMVA|nr:hypothetical protein EVAR_70721_1 [Eumeta japonica]